MIKKKDGVMIKLYITLRYLLIALLTLATLVPATSIAGTNKKQPVEENNCSDSTCTGIGTETLVKP
jgi:hypothetical protein